MARRVAAAPPADGIIARIASITIKGVVIGTEHPLPSKFYGITAQLIGSFKSLGFTAPLPWKSSHFHPLRAT